MKVLSYITSFIFGIFLFLLFSPSSAYAQVTSGPVNPYSFWAKSGPVAGQVTIYWTDDSTAGQYDVIYGTAAGKYTWGALNIGAVQDAVNSYTVGALTPGVTYYFSLIAKNGDTFVARTGPVWARAASGQVPAQTAQASVPVAAPMTSSGPVGDFSFRAASGITAGTIDLMWIDNGTASQYDLVYGTTPGQYTFGVQSIQQVSDQTMKFTVGALTPGVTYYFVLYAKQGNQFVSTSPLVSARATGGTVALASNTASPVAPAPAVQPVPAVSSGPVSDYSFSASTGMTSETVDLTWMDKETASKYDLVYGTEPGKYLYGVQNIQEIPGGVMKFTVGALTPGKRYYFALVAENNGSTVLTTSAVSAVSR